MIGAQFQHISGMLPKQFVSDMSDQLKRICAMTTVRNDTTFLEKWIAYYGAELGRENLLVLLDGHDQMLPRNAAGLNTVALPYRPEPRLKADRRRARVMSDFAAGMFHYYDLVIATDVDEFLVADPETGLSLRAYLSGKNIAHSASGLGMDVGQHTETEPSLDLATPLLSQRRFAQISARYTKAVVLSAPAVWGSGMHRVKGHSLNIDPQLYLFHFGMADSALAQARASDVDRLSTGWGNHLKRRNNLNRLIINTRIPCDEAQITTCRKRFGWLRSFFAWNRPMSLSNEPIITIPDRFRRLV